MARWTSGQSCHPFTVESVSSNLTRVIYARVFRRGSGADCKSVGLGFEWFDSILSHLFFMTHSPIRLWHLPVTQA